MEQFRNSRSEILMSVADGVDVLPNYLQILKFFSPKEFMREVVIIQTNKNVVKGGRVLNYGDFLVWIGLCFIMAAIQVFH